MHVTVESGSEQQGQGQMPAHDDLLEIQDLGPNVSDGIEQRAGDAGTVVAGDGDQQGLGCGIGHAARLSSRSGLVVLVPPGEQVPHPAEVVARATHADGEEPGADGIQALGALDGVLG
jgi:hypothetical protein